jgi:NAD(P)-dependent dehydrogenase (short-subunit alcohol dehydrogenase family)
VNNLVIVGSTAHLAKSITDSDIIKSSDHIFLLDRSKNDSIASGNTSFIYYDLSLHPSDSPLWNNSIFLKTTNLRVIWLSFSPPADILLNDKSLSQESWWINCGNPVAFGMKLLDYNFKVAFVFASSIYSVISPDPLVYTQNTAINPLLYGVSKSGMNQAIRWLSVQKITHRYNSIVLGACPSQATLNDSLFADRLLKKIPGGRFGTSSDFLNLANFLTADLSEYIRGQLIVCDGGFTIV